MSFRTGYTRYYFLNSAIPRKGGCNQWTKNQYTYAVARIRAMEVSLFSQAVIDQLLACKDEKQCLLLLQEKGWGNADTPLDAEAYFIM